MQSPSPSEDAAPLTHHSDLQFLAQKTFVVALVLGGTFLVAWGILAALDAILLVFGGLLVAILLRSVTKNVKRLTGFTSFWSLGLVLAALAVVAVALLWLLIPPLLEQFGQLVEKLPQAWRDVRSQLQSAGPAKQLLAKIPESPYDVLPGPQTLMFRTSNYAAALFAMSGILLVSFFVAVMTALQPVYYVRGIEAMFPPHYRPKVTETLRQIRDALEGWLIAKITAMAIVGACSWLGLWMLDVPLATTLALIAAILTFIPNFGPIISAVPALLMALLISVDTALWVAALYTSIQMVESYLITPRLQYGAISMPPALLVTAQLLLWAWAGVIGLIFATPLTAVALVLIRSLYIRDVLEDDQFSPRH